MKQTSDHHNAILDPDVVFAVDQRSRETLANVHAHQADTRGAMRKLFDSKIRNPVANYFGFASEEDQLRHETANRIEERHLTGYAKRAAQIEQRRLMQDDADIGEYQGKLDVAGEKATISFDASKLEAWARALTTTPSWLGTAKDFSLAKLTYHQIQEVAKDPAVLALAPDVGELKAKLGIELHSATPLGATVTLTEEQRTEIILHALIQESNLAKSLRGEAGNVVSQANVHRALDMAWKHPDLLKELSPDGNVGSVDELTAQKRILEYLLEIKSAVSADDKLSDLRKELLNILSDLGPLSARPPRFPAPAVSKFLGSLGHLDPDSARTLLHAEFTKRKAQVESLNDIGKKLEAITALGMKAGLGTDPLGSGYDSGLEIPKGFNALTQVDKWISDWKLRTTPGEYEIDIQHAKQHKKDFEHGKGQKMGKEAVLTLYKKYYEKYHVPPLSGQKAQQAAIALFAKQQVTREERAEADEIVDEMLGDKNDVLDAAMRHTKEFFKGSEYDMVINLAKSLKIKKNAAKVPYTNWEFGLRAMQSEQQMRPKWQTASYEQQLTAFWSLRKLVDTGALTNSTFVRAQMKELAHLIQGEWYLRRYIEAEMRDSTSLTPEQALALRNSNTLGARRENFSDFLNADLEQMPAYKEKVEKAVSTALEKTGKKRRKILGAGLWTGKKSIELTGKTFNVGKNTVTGTVGGISRWTVGGIKWLFTPGGGGSSHGGPAPGGH